MPRAPLHFAAHRGAEDHLQRALAGVSYHIHGCSSICQGTKLSDETPGAVIHDRQETVENAGAECWVQQSAGAFPYLTG